VTLVQLDAADAVTTDQTLVIKNVYTVELKKLVVGQTFTNIMVAKTTTTSTVEFALPETVQLSTPPLAGAFRIKCVTSSNSVTYTEDIQIWQSWASYIN
jgi:hypothetical protein